MTAFRRDGRGVLGAAALLVVSCGGGGGTPMGTGGAAGLAASGGKGGVPASGGKGGAPATGGNGGATASGGIGGQVASGGAGGAVGGSAGGHASGGSQAGGAAGTSSAGGAAGGAGGSAGASGGMGGNVSTVVEWPSFPPGDCSPTRPTTLDGPGVVDPEDLCTRRGGDIANTQIAVGEYGYGSIGKLGASGDAAYPDDDTFAITPGPDAGQVVSVTIEALDGADFQPAATIYFNGASLAEYMAPLPSNKAVARRELLIPSRAVTLQITISDARATVAASYGAGAGANYRVRVVPVSKTPAAVGAFPQTLTKDFTVDGIVGVYAVTLPAELGNVSLKVGTTTRPSGLPVSPLSTIAVLYDPAAGKVIASDLYHSMTGDSLIAGDIDPTGASVLAFAPGNYLLMVDSATPAATATRTDYDLALTFNGRPANDACAAAVDVTPSGATPVMVTGDTSYATDDGSGLGPSLASSACRPAAAALQPLAGRDVVYRVVVPAHQKLTATVTPTTSWNPAVWLSTGCSQAFNCLALADTHGTGAAETAVWTNPGSAPKTVFVEVDSSQDRGPFTLSTALSAGPAPPANDTCAGATTFSLTSGYQTISGTTDGAVDDEEPDPAMAPAICRDTIGFWSGPDVVYNVVVPAGHRMTATVSPSTSWNPALWLSQSCGGGVGTCLAAQDGDVNPEKLAWTNYGSTDQTVTLHVDAQDPVGGAFSMTLVIDTPAGSDTCPGTPRDPTVAYVATTNSAFDDYAFGPSIINATCSSAVTSAWLGNDHVASFLVPAGKTLSVTVKSTISYNGVPLDAWLAMLSATCGAPADVAAACLTAGPNLVAWKNTGASDQTVYLFVDKVAAGPGEASYNVIPSLQ
jgi:hypothetical protein